jgi:GntR family transcriptional regulator/MocR family aminotransferase
VLDEDSPTPLYRQLYLELRGRIERGELHGRLPSVKQLQQEYGVAQRTAERGYQLLVQAGFAVPSQGRGHFTVPEAERPPAGED